MSRPNYVPTRFTKGQLKLDRILGELGFQTVLEQEVEQYRLDVYVPELKCSFEYDGPWHHKKTDDRRDGALAKLGIVVVHITDKDLSKDAVQTRINDVFNEGLS